MEAAVFVSPPAISETPAKLGILAGSGALPRDLAHNCAEQGQPFFVIDLEGRASDWAAEFEHARLSLGQVGGALTALRKAGCDAVVMAGAVERPNITSLRTDWTGVKLMPRFARAAASGDDGLLKALAGFFEEEGFRVLAPHAFMSADALAGDGVLAGSASNADAMSEIALGRAILDALAPFDIGQAVVVRKSRCMAIEGAEGTAEMLARIPMLGETGGTLVKAPKRGQDERLDRPAIGPETIRAATKAGLNMIAVESGGVFLLEREQLIRDANRVGLTLFGFEPNS